MYKRQDVEHLIFAVSGVDGLLLDPVAHCVKAKFSEAQVDIPRAVVYPGPLDSRHRLLAVAWLLVLDRAEESMCVPAKTLCLVR